MNTNNVLAHQINISQVFIKEKKIDKYSKIIDRNQLLMKSCSST